MININNDIQDPQSSLEDLANYFNNLFNKNIDKCAYIAFKLAESDLIKLNQAKKERNEYYLDNPHNDDGIKYDIKDSGKIILTHKHLQLSLNKHGEIVRIPMTFKDKNDHHDIWDCNIDLDLDDIKEKEKKEKKINKEQKEKKEKIKKKQKKIKIDE